MSTDKSLSIGDLESEYCPALEEYSNLRLAWTGDKVGSTEWMENTFGIRKKLASVWESIMMDAQLNDLNISIDIEGRHPGMNGVIEMSVQEKIERLESRITSLETDLAAARQASIHPMLGNLRLQGAVLLYLCDKSKEEFFAEIEQRFGTDIARDSVRHLFSLNNAPVTDACRAELRTALNNGSTLC